MIFDITKTGTTAGGVVVFLTRDPIGYADGPNRYCYVHCNPITQFDAFGLNTWLLTWTTERGEDGAESGHSIVAVSNYDSDGKPDGTVTYYSFEPGSNAKEQEGKNLLYNTDGELSVRSSDVPVTDYDIEGDKPDGIIEFETDQSLDQSAKEAMQAHVDENPKFNAAKNNCTDVAVEGLKVVTNPALHPKESVEGRMVTTPNKTFSTVRKANNATVIRDPGKKAEKSVEDVYYGTESSTSEEQQDESKKAEAES